VGKRRKTGQHDAKWKNGDFAGEDGADKILSHDDASLS
jgi:hypothetical protein